MNPAGRFAYMGGDLFEKRDDIVVGPLLDFTDFGNPEGALFPDGYGILLGNNAKFGHSLTGEGFDFEPDFEFPLLRPNGAHLWQAVAVNHPASLPNVIFQGSLFSMYG